MTIVIFILVLAVLIFVHELGHFLTARACGIRVDEFAIGFGPTLLQWRRGEVRYLINLIPFGGYVKIFGENPDDESINGPDSARSFVNQAKWKQALVLVAGVTFNFIFAWVIAALALTIGAPASVDSYPEYANRFKNQHIAISYVEPNSPADKAGLKSGDILVGVNKVEEIQNAINASTGKGFDLKYIHDGQELEQKIIAEKGIVEDKYAIGIVMDNTATLQLPIYLAVYEGGRFTLHLMKEVVIAIWNMIAGLFGGHSELGAVTGPVGIAKSVGEAARMGFAYLLMFSALISINLGVLNLVPFPALDGGRILFVLIEAIIRRRIKPSIANTMNTVGFALLILLMVVVTYRDIVRLFVK